MAPNEMDMAAVEGLEVDETPGIDEQQIAIELLEELMAHAAKQSITETGKKFAPPPAAEEMPVEGDPMAAAEGLEAASSEPTPEELEALLAGG